MPDAKIKPVAYIAHHKAGDNLEWDSQKGCKSSPLYDEAALEVARKEGRNESIAKLLHWEDGEDLYSYPADSNVVIVALPEFKRMVNVEVLHDQLRAQLQLATEALEYNEAFWAKREGMLGSISSSATETRQQGLEALTKIKGEV